MNIYRGATLALISLAAALAGGCDAQLESKTKMDPAVDWKALEFKCVREKDLWPKASADPEAELLFQRGNDLLQAGTAKGDESYLKEAFTLTLKAAERNHVLAMNNLVVMYLNGNGVQPSDTKAVDWAEKLIRLNVGMGYYHMGTFLQQGIGVREDRKAALTYFRKAADLGNAQGQLTAGNNLRKAVAQSAPEEKARGFAIGTSMLKCALAQGSGEAGYSLGMHYAIQEEKPSEALIAFQAAAKLGHNQSLFTLAQIFKEGRYGIDKDEARATCYQRLSDESDEDKTKKFPDLDRTCPLPLKRTSSNMNR